MDLAGGDGKAFDAIELYSCFPCVPKMARRTLGLGPDVQPTVTGGLTFFGAPLNTYMTHAACAMVRKLRDGANLGLLYGQGGFVTKHHALVLSRQAPTEALAQDTSVQAEADRSNAARCRSSSPRLQGKGKVESFTVIYGRNGEVEHGVVMLRTADNARTLARVPAGDSATLAHLMNMERTPVGSIGDIVMAEDGVPEWRVAYASSHRACVPGSRGCDPCSPLRRLGCRARSGMTRNGPRPTPSRPAFPKPSRACPWRRRHGPDRRRQCRRAARR